MFFLGCFFPYFGIKHAYVNLRPCSDMNFHLHNFFLKNEGMNKLDICPCFKVNFNNGKVVFVSSSWELIPYARKKNSPLTHS